jgi:hypothetical protein
MSRKYQKQYRKKYQKVKICIFSTKMNNNAQILNIFDLNNKKDTKIMNKIPNIS